VIAVDMAYTDMAIHTSCSVRIYGVYRCSRLLENAAKEMDYTALHDKLEKEAVLEKTSLCLGIRSILTERGAV
jgi:hypothetical protein